MIKLNELQRQILQNKVDKGFNTKDVFLEFCYLHEEVSEACRAYYRKENDLGEELADVAIYLLGLAEILHIDLEQEIKLKLNKNKKRIYKKNDKGVLSKV